MKDPGRAERGISHKRSWRNCRFGKGLMVMFFVCVLTIVGCSGAINTTSGSDDSGGTVATGDSTDLAQQMESTVSDGATNVGPNDLQVSFSVPLNPDTVNEQTISLQREGNNEVSPIAISLSEDARVISIRDRTPIALARYELVLNQGIQSVDATYQMQESVVISYTSAANEYALATAGQYYADMVFTEGNTVNVVYSSLVQSVEESELVSISSQYTAIDAVPITSAANLTNESMLAVARQSIGDEIQDVAAVYHGGVLATEIAPRNSYRLANTNERYVVGDLNLDGDAEVAVMEVKNGDPGDVYLDFFLTQPAAAAVSASEAHASLHFVSEGAVHLAHGIMTRDFKNAVAVTGQPYGEDATTIRVYFARSGQNMSAPDATFTTSGYSVGNLWVTDYNGDGWDDLMISCVIGRLDTLSIITIPGPITPGNHTLAEATEVLRAGGNYTLSGNIVFADVDGDLHADMISDGYNVAGVGGNVAVFYGSDTPTLKTMETPDTLIQLPETEIGGTGVRLMGDVNNDGYQDVSIRTVIDTNSNASIDLIDDKRENIVFSNVVRSSTLRLTNATNTRLFIEGLAF